MKKSKKDCLHTTNSDLKGSEFVVKIDKLANGGWGIARITELGGMVCFISNSAPEDTLRIKVTEVHKNHLVGEILEKIDLSPHRTSPPCPHAEACGGCDWQHLKHEFQLHQKEALLKEVLQKFIPNVKFQVLPIIKSPKSFHYRSRVQPKIIQNKIGFYAKKSHQLIPVEKCFIAEEPLNLLFQQELDTHLKKNLPNEIVKLEFFLDQNQTPHARALNTEETEELGFSQINPLQNSDLIQYILSKVEGQSFSQIYDLYAGAGNFTFPLSNYFKKTPTNAVEKQSGLAELGRKQATKKPIQFINASVEIFLKRHLLKPHSLVLLDPPRGGAEPFVIRSLAKSAPQKILYVSCNPVTLARDLALYLLENPKATINSVQPFEMFPQTSHMEVIAEITP